MGFIEITDVATGKVLFDSRGKTVTSTERELIKDEQGMVSYTGPVVDQVELSCALLSGEEDWQKFKQTETAKKLGIKENK